MYKPDAQGAGGWPSLVESARLGLVVEERLVWSATDGTVGRPFARVIQALASTHVEIFILSPRPQAVVELLQRSLRGATWLSAGPPGTAWSADSLHPRLPGVAVVLVREVDGHVQATVAEGTLGARVLGGPMGVLEFLWWVSRRRGIPRANSGAGAGPRRE